MNDEVDKAIVSLFDKRETLYYSEIIAELDLDLEVVIEACERLVKQGEIKLV